MLSHVVEENQQRDFDQRPSCVHLQCLRCKSEFTRQGEGSEEEEVSGRRKRKRKAVMLPEGEEEQDEEEVTKRVNDGKGERDGIPFIL